MFFKGYIETKDKKSAEKIKGRVDFKTFEQVQSLPEYAGVLAAETVLIDIDDLEMSEILLAIVKEFHLKCRVYATSRGKHFLFKNSGIGSNKTGCRLAVGLTADIKIGTRNSYEVLKFNGKNRAILYDTADNEEAGEIPRWLFPVKSKMEFLNMDAGEGRNQGLFNYILTLQSNDFTKEEARACIRIINQFLLKEPLEDGELETILRDEAFQKPVFFSDKTFLFDKFAVFLRNNNHVVKINNQLHIFRDGIYIPGANVIEGEMIQCIPMLKQAQRMEVLKYLNIMIQENTRAADANLIAFENGIYDLTDGGFSPFTPEVVITNKIPWKYAPGSYSEIADTTLNKIACHDPEIRAILEEAIGYCFYRRNELRKAFILTGGKHNGKSTYLAMIQNLLGEQNIAALDLKELGDRFKTAELFGKLANIGDDIADEFIANPAIFKKLVTGDRVSAERKGQDPFEFNNYSKFLFSSNNIPRIKDRTGAVLDRLIIIPFNAQFSKDDPDFRPYIKYELQTPEVMQYLILLGLEGLNRIMANNGFTVSTKVQKEMDEYEESNNPIISFIRECEQEEFQIENEPTNKVYKRYQEFCISNNFQAMSNIEFPKQLNRLLGMRIIDKKINGKKCRIFVKDE